MLPKWRQRVLFAAAISLAACGGGESTPRGPGGRTPDLSDAYAYVGDSAVAGDLLACVDSLREPSSCTIGTLPPIAWRTEATDVTAIMERVVVSHDWMGERFETILRAAPAELLRLLGAVTAIVIDDDVRPSFYWSLTGAIYIDPRHLWLTPEEEATIGDQVDYRSGFGSELGFVSFSSYLEDGRPAFSGSSSRELTGRVHAVAALLFHESAHANDFLPPNQIASLGGAESIVDAVDRLEGQRLSARLVAQAPLISELWADLARVLYAGEDASAAQRGLRAEAVGLDFASDGASDPYGYSSPEEDFAMLFEETMLKLHFGFDRRVGFATPPAEGSDCRDYIVGWGAIGRIREPSVSTRASLVAELVRGDSLASFFEALPAPVSLTPGESFCIEPGPAPASVQRWR